MDQQRWTDRSCTDALRPVADKLFSLNSAALRVISSAITLMSSVFFFQRGPDTQRWGNHSTPTLLIDTPHKAFWDAMFSQEEKGEQFCFCKWKTNGAGWKIAEGWKGIATSVVPCQPQGHIPGVRIPHSGTNLFFQWQHISALSFLPSLKLAC